MMTKLENLFVYYEIEEEEGNGIKASILLDKSGKRKDLNLSLDYEYDVLVKEIANVL